MATRLAKFQEPDNLLAPSLEIQDGSWPGSGAVALAEHYSVPPVSYCNGSLPFSPEESSANQYCAPSSINSTRLSSTSTCSSSFDGVLPISTVGAVHGCSPILAGRELEEAKPSPSFPTALFSDNSLNSSSYLESSSKWSFNESRSFSATTVDTEETRDLSAGAGLANLGNTCFMNAVLQCFTHTAPFVVGIRSADHAFPCDGGNEAFCLLCAIRDHVELSLTSLGGIISPVKLVDNLSYFSSYFQRYQQEDAHEFMQCFLDKLEMWLESEAKNKLSSHDSLVNNVFGGRLVSKLCCCNCGHCSQTYEPLVDLSLEIENADSLSSALESFTRVEKIEDLETKFKCENCKTEVLVEKQLKLEKIPLVVTFHLKRFKTDGSSVEKIDMHIEFPLELDLQQYTTAGQDSKEEFKYELYAIVVHTGVSSSSGHYFSFVRSSPNTWYRMDDSKVTRVSEDHVLSQEAYILLYKRKGTLWFSNLIEHQNNGLVSDASNPSPNLVYENNDNSSPKLKSSEFCGEIGYKEKQINDLENISPCVHTINNVKPKASLLNGLTNEAEYNDGFHSLTPPGSPSPDISIFQTPEPLYRIPVDHLKIEKCSTSGRPASKAACDSEKKEALRYIKKSMPSSRGSRMIAALLGTQSEGSNKKKRMRSSPCKRSSPPTNRRKTGHNFVPFVAAEN